MKFELNKDGTEYILTKGDDVSTIIIPQEYEGKPVTYIFSYAFSGCTSLKSIIIPNTIRRIGPRAFYNCRSLTNIIIPDSVTRIEEDTFYDCWSLKSVTIGNNVAKIDGWAFAYCTSLNNITIPDSIIIICTSAFLYCTSLKSVHYNGYRKNWDEIIFGDEYANPLYYGAKLKLKGDK